MRNAGLIDFLTDFPLVCAVEHDIGQGHCRIQKIGIGIAVLGDDTHL